MRRFLAVLMIVPLAILLLGVDARASGTLEQIADSGKIRIGYRPSQPPMSYKDENGAAVGYTIELCEKIVTAVKINLGKEDIAVEFVPVDSATRFDALINNEIDILCGATTMTLDRSEKVDFTQLTFATGSSLMSLAASPVANVGDLNGKKVAVINDTTTLDALQSALKEALIEAEIVLVGNADEGLAKLEAGEVAAFSADQIVLVGLVINAEDRSKFLVSRELFSYEPFALAVRRNDADFRLVANRVLSQVYRTGEIGAIYRKWFGIVGDRMPPMLEAMYRINSTPE